MANESNSLVLGMPHKYTERTDRDSRVFKKLWGNVDIKKSTIKDTKLYPVSFRIGSPLRIRTGIIGKVLDSIGDETLSVGAAYNQIDKDWSSSTQKGLNTFTFGSATKGATNKYLEIVNHFLEMMAYGETQLGTDKSLNPFLDKETTGMFNFTENASFPVITVLASEETSISESASSEVGDSAMKKVLDFGSDITREVSFLSNGGAVNELKKELADIGGSLGIGGATSLLNTGIDSARDLATKLVGKDVVNMVTEGHQIILPKIWKGSSFSKKYSIQFRLTSPYGDRYSLAKNITIPLAYILSMALPIQKSPNSISFPFLVNVDSPGAININMGIISNISLKKGGRSDIWTSQGISRSIDVTLEVTDLYDVLPAPDTKNLSAVNQITRDYISNLVGASQVTSDNERYKSVDESIKVYYDNDIIRSNSKGDEITSSISTSSDAASPNSVIDAGLQKEVVMQESFDADTISGDLQAAQKEAASAAKTAISNDGVIKMAAITAGGALASMKAAASTGITAIVNSMRSAVDGLVSDSIIATDRIAGDENVTPNIFSDNDTAVTASIADTVTDTAVETAAIETEANRVGADLTSLNAVITTSITDADEAAAAKAAAREAERQFYEDKLEERSFWRF